MFAAWESMAARQFFSATMKAASASERLSPRQTAPLFLIEDSGDPLQLGEDELLVCVLRQTAEPCAEELGCVVNEDFNVPAGFGGQFHDGGLDEDIRSVLSGVIGNHAAVGLPRPVYRWPEQEPL